MGQKSAFEIAAQLALDETRQAVAGFGSAGALEEGLEVGEQHLVQSAALGFAAAPAPDAVSADEDHPQRRLDSSSAVSGAFRKSPVAVQVGQRVRRAPGSKSAP